MNKSVLTSIFFTVAFALTCLFLGCSQEPIFYAIDKEVKLEEAVVTGNVYDITEINGKLYAANGKIFSKNKSEIRGWSGVSKPSGIVISLATAQSSGKNYLYAVSTNADNNKTLYGQEIDGPWTDISATGTVITVVGNNAPTDANKKAYVVTTSGVFELTDLTASGTAVSGNGASAATLKAAYTTTATYFSDTKAFTSNGADTLYKSTASGVISYGTDNTNWTAVSVSNSGSPTDMCYDSVSNSLLLGKGDGFQVSLSSNVPVSSASVPGSNASATVGSYQVISVFASNGYFYAGAIASSQSKNNGLWGYYGSNRNNEWNRE